MSNIELRFNADMLVLSAPIEPSLAKQGVDVLQDGGYTTLFEPESIHDALRLEQLAGAQCLVTNTSGITKARLAHFNNADRSGELAAASVDIARSLTPQHILAEIGPTYLPIDPSSKTSLMQSRSQYAQAALDFGNGGCDALFLNRQVSTSDMLCALMGIRGVSDAYIFASMKVDGEGLIEGRDQRIEEAVSVMSEYGAAVVGFETKAPIDSAVSLVERVKNATDLPILVQLYVTDNNPKQMNATDRNPYFCADVMVDAAIALRGAGAQFLRATGNATPAYTGALVSAIEGLDVVA